MATSVKELQQYFADMDAAEEADAAAAGMTPDDLRRSRLKPEYVKENRRASRVATEEAARTGEAPRAVLYDTDRMAALEKAGTQRVPPSMQKPLERARPFSQPKAFESLGRELREPVDMPEVVPSLSMPSGVPAKTTDFASLQRFISPGALKAPEAQPIPVANASTRVDATAPVASALPSTGPQNPAGNPNSADKDGMVAPSSEGAGGDVSERDLYLARLIAQSAAGFGGMGAGKNIDMGIADTLGERLKQVQALRAKREEQGITDTRERANNRAQVDYLISRFPDRADDLQKLYGMTGKPNFSQMLRVEEQVALDQAKKATEEVKPNVALRGAEVKEGTLEERVTHNRAMEAMARAAAALAAERAARPAAEDRGVRPEALTNRLKDLNAQTKPFQELVSSLKEADAALSALGTGQISTGAKIASKIPLVGSSFVSTPELRAIQGQEGLQQSYKKIKTGLAAVGQELESFEQQFGLNWYADPRKAPLAVETLKQITQDALRRTQAPFGAGTGNAAIDSMEVLSLLKNTGGLTADNPIFQPNPKLAAAAGLTPSPAASSEGKVRMISPDGRPAKIPAADVEARKAQGWKEAP